MEDTIFALGAEYVTENHNTTAIVNGCADISVKGRKNCAFSCISESLFLQLQKKVNLEMESVDIDYFYYKNKRIPILGLTHILIKWKHVSFWWKVRIIQVEVAIGVELHPVVILGKDFYETCVDHVRPLGRNCALYQMEYRIPYPKFTMCNCVTLCECPRPQLISVNKKHRSLDNEQEESWE